MIIRKKYKLIICILWLFCSVALNGCRDRQSEMLLAGQAETENTRIPEVTEAVDVEITKTAEVEKQTEPVESQPETVETPAKIFVDVCGAVANPGVYEMEDDSRIFQVIEAAGGFLPEAARRSRSVMVSRFMYLHRKKRKREIIRCRRKVHLLSEALETIQMRMLPIRSILIPRMRPL